MSTNEEHILRAVDVLRRGGVVVYPTETAYGIGCDATNEEAVARVARIKRRPSGMAFTTIVVSVDMACAYANVGEIELRLMAAHWPGPLTMALHGASEKLCDGVKRNGTVAMRVSSNQIAQQLVEGLARPIVATSANVHGEPVCYSVGEAQAQFAQGEEAPDLYVEGGTLPRRAVSMIVEVVNGEVVVHRNGQSVDVGVLQAIRGS